MVWELIDQFVVVAIALASGFIYVHKRSEYASAFILFLVFILSQTLLLMILLTPPLILLVFVVMSFLLSNIFEDIDSYLKIDFYSIKTYELIVTILGLFCILNFIWDILKFNVLDTFSNLGLFDYWYYAYFIYIILKFLVQIRLVKFLRLDSPLTPISSDVKHIETTSGIKNIETKSDVKLLDGVDNSLVSNNEAVIIDNVDDVYISSSVNKLLVIILSIGVFIIFVIMFLSNHIGFTTYDATAHSLVIYDHNQYETELSVLRGDKAFRSDGDYSKLYKKYEEYGYTSDEILAIFDGLNSDLVSTLKKIDLSYDISNSNIQNGDELIITASYNHKKAKRNKIKVINTVQEIKIDDMPVMLSSDNVELSDFITLDEDIKTYLVDYSYNKLTLSDVYIGDNVYLIYDLDEGVKNNLLFDEQISKITIIADIHILNEELVINDIIDIKDKEVIPVDGYAKV